MSEIPTVYRCYFAQAGASFSCWMDRENVLRAHEALHTSGVPFVLWLVEEHATTTLTIVPKQGAITCNMTSFPADTAIFYTAAGEVCGEENAHSRLNAGEHLKAEVRIADWSSDRPAERPATDERPAEPAKPTAGTKPGAAPAGEPPPGPKPADKPPRKTPRKADKPNPKGNPGTA